MGLASKSHSNKGASSVRSLREASRRRRKDGVMKGNSSSCSASVAKYARLEMKFNP